MGYLRHHTIVVSGWNADRVEKALQIARAAFASAGLPGCVSSLVKHPINGGAAFFVAPDGSKEGWLDSDKGDEARAAFIVELRTNPDIKFLDWAEIELGGDDSEYRISACAVREEEE